MPDRNVIVVASNPRGVFLEGTIIGTPKPGQCMSVVPGTDPDDGGRLSYEPWNGAADGGKDEIVILREDLNGKTINDAYSNGSRGFLYIPAAGEELMMLITEVSGTGTADSYEPGDDFSIDDGTGKLIPATGDTKPFQAMEDIPAGTGDRHGLVRFRGTGV